MVMFGIIAAFGGVLLFIAAAAQAVQSHNDATGFESVSGTVIRGRERKAKNIRTVRIVGAVLLDDLEAMRAYYRDLGYTWPTMQKIELNPKLSDEGSYHGATGTIEIKGDMFKGRYDADRATCLRTNNRHCPSDRSRR